MERQKIRYTERRQKMQAKIQMQILTKCIGDTIVVNTDENYVL